MKLNTLAILNKRIIGLPYVDKVSSWNNEVKNNKIAEIINIVDMYLAVFHRRIVANIKKANVVMADITIRKSGVTEVPSRFSAEARMDKIYESIPMMAIVLFFIIFIDE